MHFIFQNPQNIINQALCVLAMLFAFAGAALVMLKPRFNRWIVMVSVTILWVLCTLEMHLSGGSSALQFVEFFFIIPWVMICFKDYVLNKLICSALLTFAWFVTEVLTGLAFGRLMGLERYYEQPYVCATFVAVAFIIVSLITLLWVKLFKQKKSEDRFTNTIAFFTVIIAEVIIIAVNFVMIFAIENKSASDAGFNIILSLVFGFLFLDVMALGYIRNVARLDKLNAEKEILATENRIQAEYYTRIQESADEAAKIRHDINNLINVIQILIKSKTDEDLMRASALADELKQTADASQIPAICNNRLVNLIIYDKLKNAKRVGISIMDNIILADNCGIDDIDLCRVFVNLIDNGINALMECEKEDKELYISCRESDGVIYIKTVNAFNSTKSKDNRKSGEYGLKIIRDICEKYEGSVTTEDSEQRFTALVALQS